MRSHEKVAQPFKVAQSFRAANAGLKPCATGLKPCATSVLIVVLGLFGSCAKAADPIGSMIGHAVAIQESLAHDKMDGVASNATAISTDAASLGKPAEKIVAGAMALQTAKKIDAARDAFGQMSEALVAYLDGQKLKPGNGVRIAFCPMKLKPWLQKEGAIRNPYYGSEMLTCGSFRQ